MHFSYTLTHSQAVCVKRIPTEISHVNRVLDGGQGSVRQPARLRALRTGQENSSWDKLPKLLKLQKVSYLKDGDLAPRDGERHRHTLAVDTKAIRLAWCSEVEAAQICDVCVPVHHCSLDVTELGCWTWMTENSGWALVDNWTVEMSLVGALVPSRLWMALVLWLGLGRKPEERPEVDEGEREGAALLLGVLRGLLEIEQPRAASWGYGEKLWGSSGEFTADGDWRVCLPPCSPQWSAPSLQVFLLLVVSLFWAVCLGWGWLSPPEDNPAAHLKCVYAVTAGQAGSWANLPVYSPPATTPLQTWLELCLQYLGKGLHETPGLNAGRSTCAI